jgi:hypothetical protein
LEVSKIQGAVFSLFQALQSQALAGQLVQKTLRYMELQSSNDGLKATLDLQRSVLSPSYDGRGFLINLLT